MSKQSGAALVLSVALALLAGCASSGPTAEQLEHQREAFNRWQACLERYTPTSPDSSSDSVRQLQRDCDGHQRDVIATFPYHQEKQVRNMLITATRQHLANAVLAQNSQASTLTPVTLIRR